LIFERNHFMPTGAPTAGRPRHLGRSNVII
jgi:hypothetical protein